MGKNKLVPMEPTLAMMEAGAEGCGQDLDRDEARGRAFVAYKAMIAAAPAVQGEPVGWQFYQDGKWWNGDDRIKDHRKNTEEAGLPVRDVYAVQQAVTVPEIIKTVAEFVGSQKGGPFTPAVIKAAILGQLEHGDAFTKLLTLPAPQHTEQPECGCCGQTVTCDDDCDAAVLRKVEQQPAAYVAGLVEALCRCRHQASYSIGGEDALSIQLGKVRDIANEALASYRKQGGGA